MQIVFCDNHLLLLVKPRGVSTQPQDSGSVNATDFGKAYLKKRYHKPGKVFLEPIHRLDTPVSGLVLFARTSKALSRLQEQMREQAIERIYLALTDTPPQAKEGVLEHYLFHDKRHARVVARAHPAAKKAKLRYRVVARTEHKITLEVQLITGRYHQIRAQLSEIGSPLLGDVKYGGTARQEGLYLHHVRMQLIHPVTKEPLAFEDYPNWYSRSARVKDPS